ncbi:DEAD/DEAH box helicase [Pseudochryseolinea flava]|uniref:ATP-dependent helicase n=1 Tax=Pseudochryseolinea flava TaxID=2059302 RepID=A0A364Y5Q0_9BACT|nr:DEAD/DEAH box helicase [Pseudochryseolinea flava]RAW02199.1 ATP-dependent helicase [Pseudochryseolinea flava]
MTFKGLDLSSAIVDALTEKGYQRPTAIQQQAIPHLLDGKDIVASASTGTGKTASFCIPILQRLSVHKSGAGIRALILTPTRELAIQVSDNLAFYGKHLSLKCAVIVGGVAQVNQVKELRSGIDILVATPGRLVDLLDQGLVSLRQVEVLVLDEADRMLDMGFINDINRLVRAMPTTRQNIFFSATMSSDVRGFVEQHATSPVYINVKSDETKTTIQQSVYYVERESKRALLKYVIDEHAMNTVIVFARTKYGADKIAKDLNRSGITAESFHGDKTQHARQRALTNFKRNTTRVLVATDIAARGIDIADLPFVINYELPQSTETYTHRIGRTGRAGQSGSALSFCDREERGKLKNINRISRGNLTVVEHPFA